MIFLCFRLQDATEQNNKQSCEKGVLGTGKVVQTFIQEKRFLSQTSIGYQNCLRLNHQFPTGYYLGLPNVLSVAQTRSNSRQRCSEANIVK